MLGKKTKSRNNSKISEPKTPSPSPKPERAIPSPKTESGTPGPKSKPGTTHQKKKELLVIKQEIYKPTFQLTQNYKLELKLILFEKA